ncbi:MAG: type pilus assembly protein PilM, partial [Thermoleophilaceae bacterium]|nr:type pilus assembly protein PilM [Thermoleophilaceae bacterium]
MAISLRKNSPRGTVGLDLDGAFVSVVQTASDGITRAISVDIAPGVITDGEVTDIPALSDALRDLFKKHSLPRRVNLGVSNQQIVVRHLELPKIENPE